MLKIYKKYQSHRASSQADNQPPRLVFGWLWQAILKRKILFLSMLFLIIFIPIAYLTLRYGGKTEAAWMDDNFAYRQRVDITNSGSAQTDYQVSITLNTSALVTAGKMQSDCDDIRITDVNGKVLAHWIETGTNACNTTTTAIWTKVPSISTTGTIVYLYYGNPSATSTQNGNNVFLFFDDFSGSPLDALKWTQTQGVSVSGGEITLDNGGSSSSTTVDYAFAGNNKFRINQELRVREKSAATNRINRFGLADAISNFFNTPSHYSIMIQKYSDSYLYTNVNNGTTNTQNQESTYDTNYHIYRFKWISGSIKYFEDVTQKREYTTGLPSDGDLLYPILRDDSITDWEFVIKTASTEPSVASPTNEEKSVGPVAYWSFDSGYGTVAQDATSNNNDGTISGATWQSEDQCISGKCLYFDGTNDVITVSNTVSGVQTVSFWVRPITTSEQFIDLNDSAYIQSSSGTVSATGFTSPIIYVNGQVSSTIVANKWQYITVTTGSALSGSAIKIGQISTNYGQVFIDDVKIYNYSRTPSEIRQDFVRGARSPHGAAAVLGGSKDQGDYLSNGLVGYWKMDEASGTRSDSSGNTNTLTDNNTVTYNPGKFGNAGQFTAANREYLSISDNTVLSTGDVDFTIAAWVYLDSKTVVDAAIVEKLSASNFEYALYYNNASDRFKFLVGSSGTTSDTITANNFGSPSLGTWYYVVGWHDSVNNILGIEINGISDTKSYSAGGQDSSASFRIGANEVAGNEWNGRIDDVRFYKRALSSVERRTLYNWAAGPVVYYNLDEGIGTTNVYDKSGNGGTGTMNGSMTQSDWVQGKYGKALEFDGSDDYIDTGYKVKSGPRSYFIWIKYNSLNGPGGYSLTGTQEVGAYTYIGIQNGGQGYFYAGNNGGTFNYTFTTNQWYYIGFTMDGTSTTKLYVNGVQVDTKTYSSDTTATLNFLIGKVNSGGHNVSGIIDEVRLYNYARTSKQIVEDMNGSHPVGGSPVGSTVGYWKFDEGYGDTAQDSSPQNNDGDLGGASQTCPASGTVPCPSRSELGKFGKALSFDGTNDYVDAGNISSVNGASQLTFSVWFNNSSGSHSPLIAKYGGDVNNRTHIWHSPTDSKVYWTVSNGSSSYGSSSLPSSEWHHYVMVFDGTQTGNANRLKAYVDGVQQSLTFTGTIPSTTTSASGNVRIGNSSTSYAKGYIDEVKIYNSALTEDEIKLDYNRGSAMVLGSLSTNPTTLTASNAAADAYCVPGDTTSCSAPVAEWKMDEKTGTNAYDTSGNGNTGTITGTIWANGKIGAALNFNGTNDKVQTSNSILTGTGDFTIEAWINRSVSGTTDYITGNYGTGSCLDGIEFYTINTNAFRVYISGSVTSTGTLNTNTWYHVAATRTSGTIKLYVNGVQDGTGTLSSSIDGPNYTSEKFDGKIDHVRVYNYARTPAQIAWDYNRGGPVGWWKFDECQGAVANDSGGLGTVGGVGGNPGTITIGAIGSQTAPGTCATSGAWYNGVTGKYNSSLNFDGTDDYVIVNSPSSALSISGGITLQTWVKLNSIPGPSTVYVALAKDGTWTGTNTNYQLDIRNSGKVEFAFRGIDSSANEYITNNTVITDTTSWHQIIVTYDGTSNPIIYVDGIVKAGSFSSGGIKTLGTNTNPLYIGAFTGPTLFLPGQIDDVRIFNYTLTATQVRSLFNQGSSVRFGPQTGSP